MSLPRPRTRRAIAVLAGTSLLLAACGDEAPETDPVVTDDATDDEGPPVDDAEEDEAEPQDADAEEAGAEETPSTSLTADGELPAGFELAADVPFEGDTDEADYDAYLAAWEPSGVPPIAPQDALGFRHTESSTSHSVRYLIDAAEADAILDGFDTYLLDTHELFELGERAETTSGDERVLTQTYRDNPDGPSDVAISVDVITAEDEAQGELRILITDERSS